MEKKIVSSSSSSGIGLCGLVFVVFLVMKLANIGVVATWSWWWIVFPLFVPIIGWVLFFIITFTILMLR